MKNIIRVIAGVALATLPSVGLAQSITESVTVEGRYKPNVIPADRLALLPSAIALTAPESPMNYDRKGVAAAFAPDALSMPVTGWRASKSHDVSRGYIDLRLGSWLNSSLSAGFAAINNQDTRLNVWLQHNSTSLWQAWKEDAEKGIPGSDMRFRYDETIGADLSHRIPGSGTLTGDLQYHLGYFNYYGTNQGPEEDGRVKAPTQTLNDLYARVGWAGEGNGRLEYTADADIRHFAYRAMYVPQLTMEYPRRYVETNGERETAINVGGDVKYSLSDGFGNASAIGAALRYSGVVNSIGNDVNRLEFKPAYTITGRTFTLRLGANLAVVGNGESTRFRVAPDVSFSARKGISAFSASIGGGTHLRTLAWMHTMDYYSDPIAGCTKAAYSPLDIKMAYQLNPGGRWTLGVAGAWRTMLDETFGGLYQSYLNGVSASAVDYGKIRGFSVSVNAGYEFSRYLAVKGNASVQPQRGKTGYLNGFDRPAVVGHFSAESKPIDKLSLKLDYRLRAKRMLSLGRLSRLDLTGEYRVTDKISLGMEIDNILNRHQQVLPGLELEGLSVMGGVQIVF